MAFNKTAEGSSMKRRPMRRRKKVCVFCGKDNVCLLYTSAVAYGREQFCADNLFPSTRIVDNFAVLGFYIDPVSYTHLI